MVDKAAAVPSGYTTSITTNYHHGKKETLEVSIYSTSAPTGERVVTRIISTITPSTTSIIPGTASAQSSTASHTTLSTTSTSLPGRGDTSTQTAPPTSIIATSATPTPTTTSLSSTSASASPASSSSSPSPAAHSTSKDFTAGDLAGAAVGCLVGGAAIAFLIAFLIFRKRRQREPESGSYYNHQTPRDAVAAAGTEKSIATSNSSAVGSWQAYLPQSADDRTVSNAVKTFFNQIDLHVDNYYHRNGATQLDPRTREALAQIDSGRLPGRIEDLMQDQRIVLPVIKHTIADLLITRLSPLTFPETSLLPPYMAEYPPKLQSPSKSAGESQAVQQAYSHWRLLNAYLYPHPEKDANYLEDREAKANEIAELLSAAFSPWQTHSGDQGGLHQHERGLVATAGNLGILLMSQPSAFDFRWTAAPAQNSAGQGFITFPGFWKTSDDQGRPLEAPQNLAAPAVPRV